MRPPPLRRARREMPTLRRILDAAAGLVRRDHHVDERHIGAAAGEMKGGEFAVRAGRREHDLHAVARIEAAGQQQAALHLLEFERDRFVESAGHGGADQRHARRFRGLIGQRRDRGGGRRSQGQSLRPRPRRAAIGVAAGLRIDAQTAAAAGDEQLLRRHGDVGQQGGGTAACQVFRPFRPRAGLGEGALELRRHRSFGLRHAGPADMRASGNPATADRHDGVDQQGQVR